MIDILERLRRYAGGMCISTPTEIEAADIIEGLRTEVAAMKQQEPAAWMGRGPRDGRIEFSVNKPSPSVMRDFNMIPLYALPGAQAAQSVPECPYPCGWRNLLKHAIEDGAYLARSINEDEPVTENARAVTMRTVMRLRDVLMAINKAAPEESK